VKSIGKTFLVYLVAIIIIGVVTRIGSPLEGIAFALGYSIRIFYITIPLLVIVYFVIRRLEKNNTAKGEA
jgi:hypothetical protein